MTPDNLAAVIRDWITDSNNVDVRNYGSNFLAHLQRQLWQIEYMMKLGRMRNSRVLDVGCGFGWESIVIAVQGGNIVTANDIRSQMIEFIDRRLSELRHKPPQMRLHPLLGDICDLDLSPDSFDAIFCSQTIEHVHTLEAMFDRAHRVLVRGSALRLVGRGVATSPVNNKSEASRWRPSHGYGGAGARR